ncbi:hypothetical protein [Vaginella massiliensis]|uniref:hypothetical protein n=1 Tax=Vaginella massiliensis TaxID=1816680 RepID=UPI001F25C94B|nr:hypothetical protein [Vaginella massiliensis]
MQKKEKWKKICSEKKISLTSLIIQSVENRLLDDERKLVLEFIEKQDNIFGKIENNINQFAKIANSKKDISNADLNSFNILLEEIVALKLEQNKTFIKIYTLLGKS